MPAGPWPRRATGKDPRPRARGCAYCSRKIHHLPRVGLCDLCGFLARVRVRALRVAKNPFPSPIEAGERAFPFPIASVPSNGRFLVHVGELLDQAGERCGFTGRQFPLGDGADHGGERVAGVGGLGELRQGERRRVILARRRDLSRLGEGRRIACQGFLDRLARQGLGLAVE